MPEKYIKKFKKLRSDSNQNPWSSTTLNNAPLKSLLLMSVIDLFAQGRIKGTFIEHSYELVDTFNAYCSSVISDADEKSMAYPFPRLSNDNIWTLVPKPDYSKTINIESVFSMVKLRKVSDGAEIDDVFCSMLSNPDSRELIRSTLMEKYFAPVVHPLIKEQADINMKAFAYSKDILKTQGRAEPFDVGNPIDKKARVKAFQKIIADLYDHRCAFCGVRMLTSEGCSLVEAAHIIPWQKSKDDHPTNGISLCKVCHWAFDNGMITVGNDYEIIVSKRVNDDENSPGHVIELSGRQILKPKDKRLWSGQDNLGWHRGNVFC